MYTMEKEDLKESLFIEDLKESLFVELQIHMA